MAEADGPASTVAMTASPMRFTFHPLRDMRKRQRADRSRTRCRRVRLQDGETLRRATRRFNQK
jgi:hypothetical protein